MEDNEEASCWCCEKSTPDSENKDLRKFKDRDGNVIHLDKNSLYCFRKKHPLRRLATSILFNGYFESIVMLAITGNSIALALYDYRDPADRSEWN